MTIPTERATSLIQARDFLRLLLDPKETPKVPRWIRTEAYWCLRHYPDDHHLIILASIIMAEGQPGLPKKKTKAKKKGKKK